MSSLYRFTPEDFAFMKSLLSLTEDRFVGNKSKFRATHKKMCAKVEAHIRLYDLFYVPLVKCYNVETAHKVLTSLIAQANIPLVLEKKRNALDLLKDVEFLIWEATSEGNQYWFDIHGKLSHYFRSVSL